MRKLEITSFPLFQVNVTMTVVFHIGNMAKDVDNLLKFVLDGLQKVAYTDDHSVAKIVIEKRHDAAHRFTFITLEPYTV